MKFIISKKIKYYTKEAFKLCKVASLGIIVIVGIVIIKYKPAYQVTISGETLGFITDKQIVEDNINEYINEVKAPVAFVEVNELPNYELKLVSRKTDTVENVVLAKVKENSVITYKTFAITLNGEEKFEVESIEEAEKIVNQIKEGISEKITFDLGIIEKYSEELKVTDENTIIASLNETKNTKIQEYKAAQAAAAAKKAAQRAAALASSASNEVAKKTLANLSLSRPVSGTVTSRYGSRSRGFHTGMDIATAAGTPITSIATGTVVYSGWKGSYGNLVIVDHGNGVQSYYAHCSSLNVSVGQTVNGGTVIAGVGSTGNSTGPHLHLEIRVNGSTVNPQNYLY